MTWLLIAGLVWLAVALVTAPLIGHAIRLARWRQEAEQHLLTGNFVTDDRQGSLVAFLPLPEPPQQTPPPDSAVSSPHSDGPDPGQTSTGQVWTGHPSLPDNPAVHRARKPPVPPSVSRPANHSFRPSAQR